MKILVLAPHSNPWNSENTKDDEMNVFIRESTEALVTAGHDVKVCLRRSTENDNFNQQKSKNLSIFFIDAGPTKKMNRDDSYKALKESDFNKKMIKEADLVIAHGWLSEPWIKQIAKKYHGRILYFSHSFSLNPHNDSYDPLQLKSEMAIAPRVTWCAYSKTELSIMSEVLPEGRIFYVRPGSATTKEKGKIDTLTQNYSWKSWADKILEIGMKTDNLLKTKFLNVSITPKNVNNQIIWFEKVLLPGSVHVLPQNEDGSYEFIIEDRPQEGVKNKLRVLSGIIEKGEDPKEAAHRELLEEMGWQADDLKLLWHSITKGTVEDHRYYFIAQNITRKKDASLETTEVIRGTKSLTKEEILERVKKGDFGESYTAIALLKLCGILTLDNR